MKKKYIFTLVVIGIMIVLTMIVGTGYGVYLSTRDKDEINATTLDCFKIYYSDSDTIEIKNVTSVTNEVGLETSPYTLAVTNVCEEDKELQVRLNILKETTVDTKALTIEAAGNIEQKTILYKNLSTAKTVDENVKESKLIGLINVKPNETVRTNIRLWFDEVKAPIIPKGQVLKAKFELIDTASAVKPTIAEMLLSKKELIDSKEAPSYNMVATNDAGLYPIKGSNGVNYYYRGVVTNNYVNFAGLLWRIVSINSDNTIKLILAKSATNTFFNEKVNEKDFVGLSYLWYKDKINSNIYNYLNNWYKMSIIDKGLDSYVVSSSYCNDTNNSTKDNHTYFGAYNRLVNAKSPSIVCTKSNADFGGIYNLKVGLITADEVAIAGGVYHSNNIAYYLANGENFYTMTPAEFNQLNAYVFIVNNSGMLTSAKVSDSLGIRPVINLRNDLTVSGKGTSDNPYIIDMN